MQNQIPEKVLELLRRLREAGLRPVLMGGAVRDLYHGKTPRDWDILFLSHWVDLGDDAETALSVVDKFAQRSDEYRDYEFYPAYGESRLFGVVKLYQEEIDLIFYDGDNADAATLAGRMDTTLNAYWIDPEVSWDIQYLPNASHVTGLIEVQRADDPPTTERLQYLAEKYPQYKVVV